LKRTLTTEQAGRLVEGFVGGGFVPSFVTQPNVQIGGLAGVSPGLQDELDKLVRKLKRKDLRRRKRKLLADQDYVSRIVNAVLAVRATKIVGGQ
jgi:hypothetical protein